MGIEDKIERFMAGKFNPTLSWDGVSVLSACILCVFWFGSMHDTIKQHQEILRNHEEAIKSLSEGQKLISQNIAVLQTLVNERTHKLP